MIKTFQTGELRKFKMQALLWASRYKTACYFDSNAYSDPYSAFDVLIGAGLSAEFTEISENPFSDLQQFLESHPDFTPGYLSYDLKNHLEDLESNNPDHLGFPSLYFFQPLHTLRIKGTEVEISSPEPDQVWKDIHALEIPDSAPVSQNPVLIKSRFTKAEYVETVEQIRNHIRRGDIYEMNFCQEFYSENCEINPVETFIRLNQHSPTPFASFFKIGEAFILSASPERFLSRRGEKLISQPIKGTLTRSEDLIQDEEQKRNLQADEKERAENVMIVDLVRNDLTKSAAPGTVRVEELFGVYTFRQVHQLISTVVCDVRSGLGNSEIIANTFPMGSMTGAPKISAMKLAEKYEKSRRGVYSGAAGYLTADGDFDLNVIIRTILYNSSKKYLSYQTGGAITIDSDPLKEYEECMLKGLAIREVLENKNTR